MDDSVRTSHHISDLDGLRGLLALLVVVFHYGLTTMLNYITGGLTQRGEWGLCVDVFFIISGFVLIRSYHDRPLDSTTYFLRRTARLYPLMLLTTVLATALASLNGSPQPVSLVLANLLSVQSLFGLASINWPSWSVPFEIFIPVAAVVFFGQRLISMKIIHAYVILALGVAVGMIGIVQMTPGEMHGFPRAVGGLAIGAALCKLRARYSAPPANAPFTFVALAGMVSVMAFADQSWLILAIFYPLAIATVWMACGATSVLSSAPAQFLGRISYPIYLIHIPVLDAALLVSGSAFRGGFLTKLALCCVCVGVAIVLERIVEQPILVRLRRSRRQPADAPLFPSPEKSGDRYLS